VGFELLYSVFCGLTRCRNDLEWLVPQARERLQLIWSVFDKFFGRHVLNLNLRNIALQTWKGILTVHSKLPRLLNPWSQDSAVLDDPLCRKAPIPLELVDSWLVFDAILDARFQHSPGLQRIKERYYTLQDATSKEAIQRTENFQAAFRPGRHIVMSALFPDEDVNEQSCPGCRRQNSGGSEDEICCPCGMRYQRIQAVIESGKAQGDSSSSEAPAIITDVINDFTRVRLTPPVTVEQIYGTPIATCCYCGSGPRILASSPGCRTCGHNYCETCSFGYI
jgi:hypothetical protein